ncbi:unnamed protein product [Prunus armeniaca]|uniref:Uncharacterized protein n=1 Tax=Prunus armeniaca TaxID=36596 RepID=A0A6J5WGX6_PRUAR|nr:unnamed protein product [Prunus armeniaca]
MDVSTATLQPSCFFPTRAPQPATRDRASSLSFVRTSYRSISLSSKITNGCLLPVKQPAGLLPAATVGDTTAVPHDCSRQKNCLFLILLTPHWLKMNPEEVVKGGRERWCGGLG